MTTGHSETGTQASPGNDWRALGSRTVPAAPARSDERRDGRSGWRQTAIAWHRFALTVLECVEHLFSPPLPQRPSAASHSSERSTIRGARRRTQQGAWENRGPARWPYRETQWRCQRIIYVFLGGLRSLRDGIGADFVRAVTHDRGQHHSPLRNSSINS